MECRASTITRLFLVLISLFPAYACSSSKYKEMGEQAVSKFHEQYNHEQYREIYTEASEEFRQHGDEEQARQFFGENREKFGTINSSTLINWRVEYRPKGAWIFLNYNTSFTKGTTLEQFVWRVQDNQPLLITYNFNPSLDKK